MKIEIITPPSPRVEVASERSIVEVFAPTAPRVVEVVIPGPVGPQGPAGASTMSRIAGAPVSALRAVALLDDGTVVHADQASTSLVASVVGISTTAAVAGDPVSIVFSGVITGPGSLIEGPVFVGAAGALTQTPPASGALRQIGFARGGGAIAVSIHPMIVR